MKILYGCERYYPFNGGAENSLMRLAHEISKSHDIKILTLNYENLNCDKRYLDKFGNEVINLCGYFLKRRLTEYAIDKVYGSVYSFIDEYKPDIIHGNFLGFFSYILCLAATEKNIPYIQTVCGSDIYRLPHKEKYYRQIGKQTLNNSRFIIAKSNDLKEETMRVFGIRHNKISVVTNGIDITVTPRFNTSNINKYVLAVGAIKWAKGFDMLCDIAKKLLILNPNIKILLIGSGPDFNNIKTKIKKDRLINLFLAGEINHNKTLKYIRNSRFMISTSRFEGCPNNILEGFSFKKPAVGFRVPGVKNLINDGINGILIYPFDIDSFAAKINILFHNNKLIAALGNNAYLYAKNYFKWKDISEAVIKHYRSCLRRQLKCKK